MDTASRIKSRSSGVKLAEAPFTWMAVSRRRAPFVFVAIVWAGVALLPTQSVIAKLAVISEKPLYLAWVGPALLSGWLWIRLIAVMDSTAWRRRACTWAVALGLAVAAVSCAWRVGIWSDDRRLWGDALAKNPNSSRVWNNVGLALGADDPTLAAVAFRRAVALNPENDRARENLQLYAVLEDR